MDEIYQASYGEVRARELEQFRSSFDARQILTAIDELNHFYAECRRELRNVCCEFMVRGSGDQ